MYKGPITWSRLHPDPEKEASLAGRLGVPRLLARLLLNRGISTPEAAGTFLHPSLGGLADPSRMKDMDRAVERICLAIERDETIALFGDYDADGITAAAVLKLFLDRAGAKVLVHLPDRLSEGYGLNKQTLDALRARDVRLLITIDCGISDHEEVLHARGLGMDVIVTDHHEVLEELPDALAVVNPKRADCDYPYRELSGVGVAFNLLIALRKGLRERGGWSGGQGPNLRKYLDLVALGTLADVVPLKGPNRILVKFGLDELSSATRPSLRALKQVAGSDPYGNVEVRDVLFRLVPRINAAGRMGHPSESFRLLVEQNPAEAQRLARLLDERNKTRQSVEQKITREAREMIERDGGATGRSVIVLASGTWHHGVIGISASRLVEAFQLPTALIAVKDGVGRGSVRSFGAFNVAEALSACREHLVRFGGHPAAAGLTVEEGEIGTFREAFSEQAARFFDAEPPGRECPIDGTLAFDAIDLGLLEVIDALKPFGEGNPEPLFTTGPVEVVSARTVGTGHLKMLLRQGETVHDAIGFSLARRYSPDMGKIEIAFVPTLNDWNGIGRVQLKLMDLWPVGGGPA